MKAKKTWTEKKTASLLRWYKEYQNKENTYSKISKRLRNVSPDACYKKLGRLGVLDAPWAKKYKG